MSKRHLVNHMVTTNDTNGNPRRVFVVQDRNSGLIVETIDEGYLGGQAWREKYPNAVEGLRFTVTPGEYRNLVKNFRKD